MCDFIQTCEFARWAVLFKRVSLQENRSDCAFARARLYMCMRARANVQDGQFYSNEQMVIAMSGHTNVQLLQPTQPSAATAQPFP